MPIQRKSPKLCVRRQHLRKYLRRCYRDEIPHWAWRQLLCIPWSVPEGRTHKIDRWRPWALRYHHHWQHRCRQDAHLHDRQPSRCFQCDPEQSIHVHPDPAVHGLTMPHGRQRIGRDNAESVFSDWPDRVISRGKALKSLTFLHGRMTSWRAKPRNWKRSMVDDNNAHMAPIPLGPPLVV